MNQRAQVERFRPALRQRGLSSIDLQIIAAERETLLPPRSISAADEAWWMEENRRCQLYAVPSGDRDVPQGRIAEGQRAFYFNGTIFDETGFYHHEGFLCAHQGSRLVAKTEDFYALDFDAIASERRVPGRFLAIGDLSSYNFYHFLVETLPALLVMREAGLDFRPMLSARRGRLAAWQEGFLHMLGVTDLLLIEEGDEVVCFDALYWRDARGLEHVTTAEIAALRDRCLRSSWQVHGRAGPRKIYIRRRSGARGLTNDGEVEAALTGRGFTALCLEEMTVVEQITAFRDAEIVVSTHGAGLSNILFCPRGAHVIELLPENGLRNIYWLLASKLGLNYRFLRCVAINGYHGMLTVDVDEVLSLI